MKTKILNTILLSLFILSISLNAQAVQEEKRAVFLTKYYSEYQNKLNSNDSDKTSRIEIIDNDNYNERKKLNPVADSLMQTKKIANINANCLNSLYHENKGVVESAIYVSIQFKNNFPNEDISTLLKALENIIIQNEDSKIIYKAQLAKMYIENSEWFNNIEINSIEQESKVYADIAQTINRKMFSAAF